MSNGCASRPAAEIKENGMAAAVALSGIEQCLWDIHGKALGVPVHDLFGGKLASQSHPQLRQHQPVYGGSQPAGFAAIGREGHRRGIRCHQTRAVRRHAEGLTDAAKIEEFTRLGLDRAAAVRKVIGPKRDLLIDVHSHFDLAHGRELARRFEPLNLFWLEEVTPPKPLEWLATINREPKMPTAGGESIYGVRGFYPYIAGGAVDIVMPDVKIAAVCWS